MLSYLISSIQGATVHIHSSVFLIEVNDIQDKEEMFNKKNLIYKKTCYFAECKPTADIIMHDTAHSLLQLVSWLSLAIHKGADKHV